MSTETKTINPVTLAPVIQAPQLIKVLSISNKVAEQLAWNHSDIFQWAEQEIVGRLAASGIITRHKVTGQLSKVGDMVFLKARSEQLMREADYTFGPAREQANTELAAIPQLFTH